MSDTPMKETIQNRIQDLSSEVEALTHEKTSINSRLEEIEIRLHQLVGAIYELQMLLDRIDDSGTSQENS